MKEIRHIGIVGEGKMGKSIFFYLDAFNFRLTWLVSSEAAKVKALKLLTGKIKCLVQSGVLTEAEFALKTGSTTVTTRSDDLRDCDLIIEAITEDIGMKRSLFESLDRVVNSGCIFASNSSAILPSELLYSEKRKDRFCGLHFFYPLATKNIAELIINSSTAIQIKESLHQFLAEINKTAFVQDETNAFILNRLFLDFQAGAYNICREGILSYHEIDELVRLHLFPVGVFEFFDHVGIDVMLSSVKAYTREMTDKGFYSPLLEKLEELVKLNCLGMKTKQGFYDYTQREEKANIDPGTAEDKSGYKRQATERLWNYFIKSANSVIEQGLSSREDLAYAIKDYMGMDDDPFKPPF